MCASLLRVRAAEGKPQCTGYGCQRVHGVFVKAYSGKQLNPEQSRSTKSATGQRKDMSF